MVVVVLDEAVERAELRQVGAEHARVVHPPERSRHAPHERRIERNRARSSGTPAKPDARGAARLRPAPVELDVELAAELLGVPEDAQDAGGIR
jgi:hypothetical protein